LRALGFADDLKLFMNVKNTDDFQKEIDRLAEWCRVNKFNLNISNCKIVYFCRNTQPIDFLYTIDGNALKRVNDIKDLGVVLDKRLTFLPHIESVIAKSSNMLGFPLKKIIRESVSTRTADSLDVIKCKKIHCGYIIRNLNPPRIRRGSKNRVRCLHRQTRQ
jgi:hypothetical protein